MSGQNNSWNVFCVCILWSVTVTVTDHEVQTQNTFQE